MTDSMKNTNERWTTWREIVDNFVLQDNCPPHHFAKDCKRRNKSQCHKCCEKYTRENMAVFV